MKRSGFDFRAIVGVATLGSLKSKVLKGKVSLQVGTS
jgi:hypothetical protein